MSTNTVAKLVAFVCLLACNSLLVFSQGSAGTTAPHESRMIIDLPTAGVLTKNTLGLTTVVFAEGGILADLSFAPTDNFNIGLGYSGLRILGSGTITWQGIPSMHLRYRAVDETLTIPAILIGLQTQGRGGVYEKRFQTYAPGIFASVSKQFKWDWGTLAFHGGAGYSLNLGFNGEGFNLWGGVEQSLGKSASIMAEVNPTFNDTSNGFLFNLALRWAISNGITMELQARDLLVTMQGAQGFTRTLGIEVIRSL